MLSGVSIEYIINNKQVRDVDRRNSFYNGPYLLIFIRINGFVIEKETKNFVWQMNFSNFAPELDMRSVWLITKNQS